MRIRWYQVIKSIPKVFFRILESFGNNMKQTLSEGQWEIYGSSSGQLHTVHMGPANASLKHPLVRNSLKPRQVTLTTPVVMRMLGSKFDKWASMAVAKHSSELWGAFLSTIPRSHPQCEVSDSASFRWYRNRFTKLDTSENRVKWQTSLNFDGSTGPCTGGKIHPHKLQSQTQKGMEQCYAMHAWWSATSHCSRLMCQC